MRSSGFAWLFPVVLIYFSLGSVFAAVDGTISGVVSDAQGVALSNVTVELVGANGKILNRTTTSIVGDFQFFPVQAGEYDVIIRASGFSEDVEHVQVVSGATTEVSTQLSAEKGEMTKSPSEMLLEVKAKKHLIQTSSSTSRSDVNQKRIQELPQGNEITLPRLITTTTPGAVQGAYGQIFFRGNHGNIQYQIDGVQLPDSPSGTFAQTFSPRNIDRMEVITGGIPAEFGLRLGAVVNILTKSGPETPEGEVQLNYGSYNTFNPHLLYGGTNQSGNIRYYFGFNYNRTDRGLDTPQPQSPQNQEQGGKESIHNFSTGNSEFGRVDWLIDDSNKLTFTLFNAMNNFEIPNYPSSFSPSSNFFSADFDGKYNGHSHGDDEEGDPDHVHRPVFVYRPAETNDTQSERNTYFQTVWKRAFSENSFLLLAPYYKYSTITVGNDPINDLTTAQYYGPNDPRNSPSATRPGRNPIDFSAPTSVALERNVHNIGLKSDYSWRPSESHWVKTGFQLQGSYTNGFISVQRDLGSPAFVDNTPNRGFFESVYIQDDYRIFKPLTLNAGLRFDATQFRFGDDNPNDSLLQPRLGLSYMATESTKLHVFYGKLFQPASMENFRTTFNALQQPGTYDVKAEKDDYYEAGISQQIGNNQLAAFTIYYKDGVNILDDAQLLNTRISQPFNYATGFGYGAEASLSGKLTDDWSEFVNYSYTMAKGKGLSGGTFAAEKPQTSGYIVLDHVQEHTANAGLIYAKNNFSWTTQGLFGSGLRTGELNRQSLPSHFSFDTSVGYQFTGKNWWSNVKLSGDVLNIFDNVFPITIANEFNGTNYAAGRQFFLRLTKSL